MTGKQKLENKELPESESNRKLKKTNSKQILPDVKPSSSKNFENFNHTQISSNNEVEHAADKIMIIEEHTKQCDLQLRYDLSGNLTSNDENSSSHVAAIEMIPKEEMLHDECLTTSSHYFSNDLRINVYKCLNEFYEKRILPNISDVYEFVKDKIPNLTYSQFEHYMKRFGYTYLEMPVGNILMEDPKITFERFFYLNDIMKMRQMDNRHLYYIDQRFIDTTLTFQKPSLKKFGDSFKSSSYTIFLYIISAESGQVNGIFTNHLNFENFDKWIADVVLNVLSPNSVVVMDDNFKQTASPEISMYDTKDKILRWLNSNSVPCTDSMRKAELYELYKKCPRKKKIYEVSSILEARGHKVLHLPPNLSDLSPTNYFWNDIKRVLSSQSLITLMCRNNEGVSNLISQVTTLTMSSTTSYFIGFDKLIAQQEKQIFELDMQIENHLDELIKVCGDKESVCIVKTESENN